MNSSGLYTGKRFRKAIQHFLLGRAAQSLTSFILTLWLVRLLGASDYGAYMVLWGMVEMMVPLSSLGMLEAVRRFLPELAVRGEPEALKKFVAWMTLIRLAIMVVWTLVIAVFWVEITTWLGFSELQQNATLLGLGLIITVLGFRYAAEMLECLLEQRWSQLTHAFMPLGRLLGVAILVMIESITLEQLLWVDLIVAFICFMLCEYFLIRKLQNLSGSGNLRVSAYEIANFAWHMAGVNLCRAVASMGALRILVARVLGLEIAGMYAFLQQLLIIIGRYLPANLLANIIRPMLISRKVAGDYEIVGQGIALLWKSNLLIIALSMIAISIGGDEIIALVSGGRFTDAGLFMLIMLFGLGTTSQGQLISMVMEMLSYTRQLRFFSLLLLLTPVVVFFGVNWGLLGVISGIVLNAWIMNSIIMVWLKRQVNFIKLDWFGILRGIGLATFLAGIGLFIKDEFGVWLTLTVVILAYGLGLFIVKPLNSSDVALLNRGIRMPLRFLTLFAWNEKSNQMR